MENKSKFMLRAIELSIQSAKANGGPFGCVIVKNDTVIGSAVTSVGGRPHAEFNALNNKFN